MEEDIDRRKSGDGKKVSSGFSSRLGGGKNQIRVTVWVTIGEKVGVSSLLCCSGAQEVDLRVAGCVVSRAVGRVTCCTRSQKTLLSGFFGWKVAIPSVGSFPLLFLSF